MQPTVRARPVLWCAEIGPGYHNPESLFKIQGLREAGHRVEVVHPIGGASLGLRTAGAALRHLRGLLSTRLRRASGSTSPGAPQPTLRLAIWPVRHGRFTRPLNTWLVTRQLRTAMAELGIERPILWLRFPSPELVDAARRLDDAIVVYDLIDYIPNRPLGRRGVRATREAELLLMRTADLVLASSGKLLERAEPMGGFAVFHPHGVDLPAFRSPGAPPDDVARLPAPRIGYTGGDDWVDVGLVTAVADRHPDASVVIVGPWRETPETAALASRPNVHLLGPRPHEQMPAYMASLDVGLLPYRRTIETEHLAPVKAREYLAVGLPCVATDVPYLREFDRVMRVARSRCDFLEQVSMALEGDPRGDADRRRAAVEADDWSLKNARLAALVDEAVRRHDGA